MDKLEFYIEKFSYIESIKDIDLGFVPPLLKRKLSPLNKAVFYTFNNCFSEKIENIIYASRFGEFDKLQKLIGQYTTENEVSPTLFSASVHNYTVGAFSVMNKISKPYSSLAACHNSLSMGLVNSIITLNKNLLFCFADYINEEPNAIAMLLSKQSDIGEKCVLTINDKQVNNSNELQILLNFINKKTNVASFCNYKIERVHNE